MLVISILYTNWSVDSGVDSKTKGTLIGPTKDKFVIFGLFSDHFTENVLISGNFVLYKRIGSALYKDILSFVTCFPALCKVQGCKRPQMKTLKIIENTEKQCKIKVKMPILG